MCVQHDVHRGSGQGTCPRIHTCAQVAQQSATHLLGNVLTEFVDIQACSLLTQLQAVTDLQPCGLMAGCSAKCLQQEMLQICIAERHVPPCNGTLPQCGEIEAGGCHSGLVDYMLQ